MMVLICNNLQASLIRDQDKKVMSEKKSSGET